jgi:type IV pilus assembly protein PilC
MAHFNYWATDNQNKEIKGSLEAKDMLEAKTKLRQSGLYIIRINKGINLLEKVGFEKVKNQDLAIFSHQFAIMISSGIPLIRALQALAEESTNKKLSSIIEKVRFDVENGTSLSEALIKHPTVFSDFFVTSVKSGEAAGILPAVLNRLASHLEKEEELKRKVSSGFAYPAIVGFVAMGVVAFMLVFIVPVFKNVYKALKINLPGPTITLIAVSNIFIKFWWVILLLIGFSFYASRVIKQNKELGLIFDRFKLRIPVFGQLNRKVSVSRFVRTLSTMMASGLSLNSSLNIVKDIVGNRVISNSVETIQKEINQGKQISDALKSQGIYPSIVIQMISVGEESGNLNPLLDKAANFLDEDIDTIIKNLVVKLEPTLTLLLAALIGFIALAIYLPMFDLIHQVGK